MTMTESPPVEAAEAEQLTKMPSVTELKQMLVSVIASPLTGILGVAQNVLADEMPWLSDSVVVNPFTGKERPSAADSPHKVA